VSASEEHARKVLSYVELARSEGATVECGGERVSLSGTVYTHFFISEASRWKGSVLISATVIIVLKISVVLHSVSGWYLLSRKIFVYAMLKHFLTKHFP
jgi:hypothetical protein